MQNYESRAFNATSEAFVYVNFPSVDVMRDFHVVKFCTVQFPRLSFQHLLFTYPKALSFLVTVKDIGQISKESSLSYKESLIYFCLVWLILGSQVFDVN